MGEAVLLSPFHHTPSLQDHGQPSAPPRRPAQPPHSIPAPTGVSRGKARGPRKAGLQAASERVGASGPGLQLSSFTVFLACAKRLTLIKDS